MVFIFSKTDFMLQCMLIKATFPSDAVVLSFEHFLIAHVCFFSKASGSLCLPFSCVNINT